MNLLIKSAKIIDSKSPFHLKTQDILIENGKIIDISTELKNIDNIKEIKLENLHVSVGWFDTSVSFGEPGFEERETMENGLSVAARSGFTAVAMNPNTCPLIDNKAAVEFLINKAKGNIVNLYPIANLTQQENGLELAELYDMSNSGAIAFSDYNKSISNANLMKIALLYTQNFDGLILSFPQDLSLSNQGVAHEGAVSTKLGLKGIPSLAEELQIARDLFLIEYTGGKLHIPTISTEKSVKLIAEAKKKGLNVTCSVSAHHLFLTDRELKEFDTNYKVKPPLRIKSDVNALKKGIVNGTIDIITSDHNPIDIENKKVEFENAKNGTIGLESFFGAINKVLPLEKAIDCITKSPRKRFNIANPVIALGEMANITLFNPEHEYTFSKENIISTSKNSAFIGKQLKGKVYGVFANNKLVIN